MRHAIKKNPLQLLIRRAVLRGLRLPRPLVLREEREDACVLLLGRVAVPRLDRDRQRVEATLGLLAGLEVPRALTRREAEEHDILPLWLPLRIGSEVVLGGPRGIAESLRELRREGREDVAFAIHGVGAACVSRPLVGHAEAVGLLQIQHVEVFGAIGSTASDRGHKLPVVQRPLRPRRGEAGELGAELRVVGLDVVDPRLTLRRARAVKLALGLVSAQAQVGYRLERRRRFAWAGVRVECCLAHLRKLPLRLLGAGDGGLQFAVHGVRGVLPRRLTPQRASRLVERARWRVHAHSLLGVCIARTRRILRAEVLADAHTLAILAFVR